MRVQLVHHCLRRGGGMEQYGLLLAETFVRLGVGVSWVTPSPDARLAAAMGIHIRPVQAPSFPRKWRDVRLFRESVPAADGIRIALSPVAECDIAVSGGTHPGYMAVRRSFRWFSDALQIRMERLYFGRAPAVVAHSRRLGEEIRSAFALPDGRVEVLYPPVDATRFRPVPAARRQELRRRFGIAPEETVFLFVSTGHRRKGLPDLVRAFAAMPPGAVLAVAGRPVRGALPPAMRHWGYLDAVEEAYAAADFTVLASDYEPFGLVAVESVLCGTPVILADTVGAAEVLPPSTVRSFRRGDHRALVACLEQALRDAAAARGREREPLPALLYNPDPADHARDILRIGERLQASRNGCPASSPA